MCGIIGIIKKQGATTKYPVWDLFKGAIHNKHRGDKDGVGAIVRLDSKDNEDRGNLFILKSLLQLDEIENNKLESSPEHDKERKEYKKRLSGALRRIDKLKNESLNFGILHQRNASYGVPIEWSNIHPFKISKGIYYLHNGVIYEGNMLKNYLELHDRNNFRTSLDSEVLAFVAEEYLKDNKYTDNAFKTVKRYLDAISSFYGVLIRVDIFNNNILIIKDNARGLYLTEQKDAFILSSEPLPYIKSYTQMFRLNDGVFSVNEQHFRVLTPSSETVDLVNKKFEYVNSFKPVKKFCDFCKKTKETYSLACRWDDVNICMDCFLQDNETTIKLKNSKQKSATLKPPFKLKKNVVTQTVKRIEPNKIELTQGHTYDCPKNGNKLSNAQFLSLRSNYIDKPAICG